MAHKCRSRQIIAVYTLARVSEDDNDGFMVSELAPYGVRSFLPSLTSLVLIDSQNLAAYLKAHEGRPTVNGDAQQWLDRIVKPIISQILEATEVRRHSCLHELQSADPDFNRPFTNRAFSTGALISSRLLSFPAQKLTTPRSDIKPLNIYLMDIDGPYPVVKLGDFGSAIDLAHVEPEYAFLSNCKFGH